MTTRRRNPRLLGGTLETFAQRLAPATTLAQVQTVWPDAVGATIAARAKPVAERAGVLTISCESSVWAQELDLMGEEIVERLNDRLGGARLERLRCTAGYPAPTGERPWRQV